MGRKTIDENKTKIRNYYKKEQWFESYISANSLLLLIQKSVFANDNDFMFCYIFMSNCMRRMQKLDLALEFAYKSLNYAREIEEVITCNNTIAICYGESNDNLQASEIYDKNIELYKSWINNISSEEQEKDRNRLTLSMANAVQNKGYYLKDVELIKEAINMYRTLKNKNGIDKEIIQRNLNESYESLSEIEPNLYIMTNII